MAHNALVSVAESRRDNDFSIAKRKPVVGRLSTLKVSFKEYGGAGIMSRDYPPTVKRDA